MKTLTPRQALIELIRTHHDALTNWDPRSGGGGPLLMPSLWHEGSYRELEHRLAQMREHPDHRQPWWHLSHRYRWGVIHRETVPCRRTRQGPIPRLRPNTELVSTGQVHGHRISVHVYEWRPDVNPQLVDQALDTLLATMHGGRPDRIRLPLSVLHAAIGVVPLERGDKPASERALAPQDSRVTLMA